MQCLAETLGVGDTGISGLRRGDQMLYSRQEDTICNQSAAGVNSLSTCGLWEQWAG